MNGTSAMKPIRTMRYAALLAALLASSALAPMRQASAAGQWGEVHFPVSCQAGVQQAFDQAVAMLHSFSFGDAANTFAAVARDDPNCAMAYWGLATTAMGSLIAGRTGPAALGRGWDFVQQAKILGAKTPREGDYIAAAEAFYRDADKTDQGQRTRAYADALEQIYDKYPDDPEAAIFYAYAVTALAPPTDKTYAYQLKGAAILEKAFEAAALSLPRRDYPWARFPQAEAVLVFVHALGAARTGDATAAAKDLDRLQELRANLVAAEGDVFKDYWLTQIDVHRQMVTAWIANAQGRQEEALQTLRTAADREDAIERDPVVPGPIISARELLGEMLLESDRPQQALQAFEADLRNEPGRFWSLYEAAQAAERAGDRERARSFYSDLVAQTVHADQDRPALKAARTFLQATKG